VLFVPGTPAKKRTIPHYLFRPLYLGVSPQLRTGVISTVVSTESYLSKNCGFNDFVYKCGNCGLLWILWTYVDFCGFCGLMWTLWTNYLAVVDIYTVRLYLFI
jgi:hypothetical protein